MLTSSLLKNRNINFVFIAGCNEDNFKATPSNRVLGEIFYPFMKGRTILVRVVLLLGTDLQRGFSHYKEIELNTGLKHGFLYRPLAAWMDPATKWANGNYNP